VVKRRLDKEEKEEALSHSATQWSHEVSEEMIKQGSTHNTPFCPKAMEIHWKIQIYWTIQPENATFRILFIVAQTNLSTRCKGT
jgi:hypothetical protein